MPQRRSDRQQSLAGDEQLVDVQPDGKGFHPDRCASCTRRAWSKRAGVPAIRLHDAGTQRDARRSMC
jgi:hypothetical protein